MTRNRLCKVGQAVSSIAVAASLAAWSVSANAQSFQGTGTFVGGTAGNISVTANTTDITLNGDKSVINWTPSDVSGAGTINFQPVGTTATFTNGPSVQDFVVLNRILPVDAGGSPVLNRPIAFNGHVISQLQAVSAQPTSGGTLFFYTPGGIVIGASAVFDVGNLALTTSDLAYDSVSGSFDTNGVYSFLAGQAGASITIDQGAKINASVGSASDAYVALVSPRISNSGDIAVDGSAALVAADAASIEFSPDGLYNIVVSDGTGTSGDVIANDGTISGAAGVGGTVVHGVYMVAVPKNQAITIAIASGSKLGFDVAGAADVVGNAVVLSAGYNVVGGAITSQSSVGTGAAGLTIGAIDATSAVQGQATGNALVQVGAGEAATYASNLSVAGVFDPAAADTNAAHVNVSGAGSSLTIAGGLSVVSLDSGNVTGSLVSDSTEARIDVSAGTLQVTGNVFVSAQRNGLVPDASATGGTATLSAKLGGTINVDGNVDLVATGAGSASTFGPGPGAGDGTGGTARVIANNANITGAGSLQASVNGIGGVGFESSNGGDGIGGSILIDAQSNAAGASAIDFGAGQLNAVGNGGRGEGPFTIGYNGGNGGAGVGGTIRINGSASNGSVTVSEISVDVSGIGGAGAKAGIDDAFQTTLAGNGGNGSGGTITFDASGTIAGLTPAGFTTLGSLSATADGFGGAGGFAALPATPGSAGGGGSGNGGAINILASQDGSHFELTNSSSLSANGRGADGMGCTICAFDAGNGVGGAVFIGNLSATTGSTVALSSMHVDANGYGGAALSTSGGTGSGGTITIAGSGIAVTADTLNLFSTGLGGTAVGVQNGGAGTGGSASISLGAFSTLNAGTTTLDVHGVGGSNLDVGGRGGLGAGGLASVASTGGAIAIVGDYNAFAYGQGGSGDRQTAGGRGGNATGGFADFTVNATTTPGSIDVNGAALLDASAIGGQGGQGGDALGGSESFLATNGSITGLAVQAYSTGIGGDGVSGGAGTGGTVNMIAHNAIAGPSQIAFTSVQISATGSGGAGGIAEPDTPNPGIAGIGTGGVVQVLGSAGNGVLSTGDLLAEARGLGGIGATGSIGNVVSDGGNGGAAFGGAVTIGLETGSATGSVNIGTATFGTVVVRADALGGAGGNAGSSGITGNGGNGGVATGGGAVLMAAGARVNIGGTATFDAGAQGGNGGAGNAGGLAGSGGNAFVGGTSVPASPLGASLLISNRLNAPAQLGSLVATALSFTANSTGGTGAANGVATNRGAAIGMTVNNGTIAADSLEFIASGVVAPASPSARLLLAGTATTANITNDFGFVSGGDLTIEVDNATLSAATVTISADNWLGVAPPPFTSGKIAGSSLVTLTSGSDLVAYSGFESSGNLSLVAPGKIALQNVTAGGNVGVSAGTTLALGNVVAGQDFAASSTGSAVIGQINAGTSAGLLAGASLTAGAVVSGGPVDFQSAGNLTVSGPITAGDFIHLSSGAALSTGALSAGLVSPAASSAATYDILAVAAGNLTVGQAAAARTVRLFGQQAISTGAVSGTDVAILSTGNQTLDGITATGRALLADYSMSAIGGAPFSSTYDLNAVFNAVPVKTAGAIALSGPISTLSFVAVTSAGFGSAGITTTGPLSILADGLIGTGALVSGDLVTVSAGGALTIASAQAVGALTLSAGGALNTGALTGNGAISVNGLASVTMGALSAQTGINVAASSGLSLNGAISSTGDIVLGSNGALSSTAAIGAANGKVIATSAGNGTFAGVAALSTVELSSANGSLSVASVNAGTDTALVAASDISVGNVIARDMALLAGGNVLVQSGLLSGNSTSAGFIPLNGRLLVANRSMASLGGTFGSFDYNAIMAAGPVRTSGSISLGSFSGGQLFAASQGQFSSGRGTATQSISVESGGLVTVGSRWQAPIIDVRSADIAILPGTASQPGGLNAGTTGTITLISLGSGTMLIGDGLGSQGYALDNTEWGLINSGSLIVSGPSIGIGTLNVTGPDAGSTIDDPNGAVRFVADGSIRITGKLVATGFRTTNALEFTAGRFELDAGTGSLDVLGTAGARTGTLRIAADGIHVASSTILDRLVADPFYVGLSTDLARAPAVARGAVLSAGAFDFQIGRTFYVQNTGNFAAPAGFLVPLSEFFVNGNPSQPLTMIINGSFAATPQDKIGIAAFDAFKATDVGSVTYGDGSQLNGCLLSATICQPAIATQQPDRGITDTIDVLTQGDGLGDSPGFGDQDENDEDEADVTNSGTPPQPSGPILPPHPLIMTKALNPPSTIEEPVAGSGNPALSGSQANGVSNSGEPQ
jgi:hypothetical protein